MKPLKAILLALTAVLAGCSLNPAYERPALPTAGTYPDATETAAPAALRVERLPWQGFFTDPVLQRVIHQALENNRDLRTAVARISEARAAYGIRRADLLPNLGAGAFYSRSRTPADLSLIGSPLDLEQYEISLDLSVWELDFWGRVRSLTQAALESYLATEAARRAATISLIAQTANTYLIARELDERVDIARKTLALREDSWRIARRRYEVGAASRLEAVQAETLRNQAQADLAALQRLRDLNRNALVLLTGNSYTEAEDRALSEIEREFPTYIAPGLPSALLADRPDIIAAEHRLKAAHAEIGAARAAFFPNIALTGSLGTASTELSGLFGSGSGIWSFVPSLTVPIFQGGRLRAGLDLAEARRNLAVAEYERTVQVAFREVADALAERRRLGEQTAALRATLDAQAERVRLAVLRYQNGAAPYLEVLEAERERFTVEQALVQTRRELLSSCVNLYAALGGGDPSARQDRSN